MFVQKRPASVPAGEDGKRSRLLEDVDEDESPSVNEVVVPLLEEEEANRIVFRDCLRETDKGLPVWKGAYQLPRERWNEKEHKLETWTEMEQNAAIATIASINEDLRSGIIAKPNHYECDSDSSDDDYPPGVSHHNLPQQQDLSLMEMRFINALPYCLPLNCGFHVLWNKCCTMEDEA